MEISWRCERSLQLFFAFFCFFGFFCKCLAFVLHVFWALLARWCKNMLPQRVLCVAISAIISTVGLHPTVECWWFLIFPMGSTWGIYREHWEHVGRFFWGPQIHAPRGTAKFLAAEGLCFWCMEWLGGNCGSDSVMHSLGPGSDDKWCLLSFQKKWGIQCKQ